MLSWTCSASTAKTSAAVAELVLAGAKVSVAAIAELSLLVVAVFVSTASVGI